MSAISWTSRIVRLSGSSIPVFTLRLNYVPHFIPWRFHDPEVWNCVVKPVVDLPHSTTFIVADCSISLTSSDEDKLFFKLITSHVIEDSYSYGSNFRIMKLLRKVSTLQWVHQWSHYSVFRWLICPYIGMLGQRVTLIVLNQTIPSISLGPIWIAGENSMH